MNKTLEFYRKLAEAYKEHGFEDYAVSELWTALEKAVLANAGLLGTLQLATLSLRTFSDTVHPRLWQWTDTDEIALEAGLEAIRKTKEK